MAKPKATEGRDTRQEILDAALELFAERGVDGTGLREIALAVGVRPGAVYHYFSSKEHLFAEVLRRFMTEARAEVQALAAAAPPDDLAPFFENLLSHVLEKFSKLRERKLFRIVISEGLKLAGTARADALEEIAPRVELTRLMERLVRAGRLEGEPELLAVELMGPVIVWRILLDAAPRSRLVTDPHGFAKRHVAHFLKAARPSPKARAGTRLLNDRPTPPRLSRPAKRAR